VAAAVTISSTIRGSRRGFMLPKRTGAERVAIMISPLGTPMLHADAGADTNEVAKPNPHTQRCLSGRQGVWYVVRRG
jgi:hypothetical protein